MRVSSVTRRAAVSGDLAMGLDLNQGRGRGGNSESRLGMAFGDRMRAITGGVSVAIDFENRRRDLAPFMSLVMVILTLFTVVFCKMEMRRMGYSVLKLTREERKMRDFERQQSIRLAKMVRPERLQAVAQAKLTLRSPESGQIIQMTDRGIALRQ